jgi:hypothetical protein
MNIKQKLLIAMCAILCSKQALAQKSAVNVNTLTGSSNVVIPIDVITRGQVSVPVNLVYTGSGIKLKDVEMNAGIGWRVDVGGQVSRSVRGLPDDCKKDQATISKLGWIYNTNQSKINSFNIQNNGSTCSNETTDINYLTTSFSDLSDTEPDMFYVSAPGLSCQLIWDQSLATPGFRIIPYRDYVVTPAFNPTTGAITGFTIVNDQGITYTFNSFESITQKTIDISGGAGVKYLKTPFSQYQNGITYNNNWHLTDILDINGNGVHLNYTTAATSRSSTDNVILYTGAAGGATTSIPQYKIQQTVTPKTLSQIGQWDYGDFISMLGFNWWVSPTGQTIITSITGNGRNYTFGYSDVKYANSWYSRSFLRSFTDPGCSTPVNYRFAYNGETAGSSGYSTTLGDSTSINTDFWGYYNGMGTDLKPSIIVNPSNASYARYAIKASSLVGTDYTNALSGTNRTANPAYVINGSLTKVYYATGGNSTIAYESNDYFDPSINSNVNGGGIRVKKIVDSAVNSPTAITRNYTYINPVTSKSSGDPISLPQFAFTTPYTGSATGNDYWNYATIRSETDLSPEDHGIMYEYVRETLSDASSTLYQNYVTATNWDNSGTPACAGCATEWSPTMNYTARTDCSLTYGPIANLKWSYPFAPNLNYEMERGQPLKTTTYDQDGVKVSEASYTYVRSSAPAIIPALNLDEATSSGRTVKNYSKYNICASYGELTATETKRLYDLNTGVNPQTSISTYTYNTAQHKLIKQEAANSDGSILTTNIKYTKDYTATGSNPEVAAIGNLQAKNVNVPVETWQQVTRGGVVKTISASLTKFKAVTLSSSVSYLPGQSFSFLSPDGAPSFTPYNITSGTPSPPYAGYVTTQNYTIYDGHGNLVTVDDAHKHTKTVITHYYVNAPSAEFSNASVKEVAFNDFDSYSFAGAEFTYSGSLNTTTDSHIGNASTFIAGQTFTRTIEKNAKTDKYIFSVWIKAANGANNTLNYKLNGGTAVSLPYTGTGTMKYYQFTIPVTSMASSPSTFSVSLGTSTDIIVDDLLLYPENTEVVTYNYDPYTKFKRGMTNTNGISAYYTNDQWGRLVYAFDQDRSLVTRNSYVAPADLQSMVTLQIGNSTPTYAGTAISFSTSGYNTCTAITGVSSTWNFGDGTSPVTTSSLSTSHVYAATGTYTVTLTSTSLLFGTQTVTTTITVTSAPPPPTFVTLHYTNSTAGNGNITNVAFVSGGTTINVPGTSLEGYTIAKGTYTITVSLSGGTQYDAGTGLGYGSIAVGGNCRVYNVLNTNTYAFSSYNMTSITNLTFAVSTNNCTPVE